MHTFFLFHQTWCRLVQDYQSLNRQLEAVEGSIPTVGLVEETEERLMDRISLYQVQRDINADFSMYNKSKKERTFKVQHTCPLPVQPSDFVVHLLLFHSV